MLDLKKTNQLLLYLQVLNYDLKWLRLKCKSTFMDNSGLVTHGKKYFWIFCMRKKAKFLKEQYRSQSMCENCTYEIRNAFIDKPP